MEINYNHEVFLKKRSIERKIDEIQEDTRGIAKRLRQLECEHKERSEIRRAKDCFGDSYEKFCPSCGKVVEHTYMYDIYLRWEREIAYEKIKEIDGLLGDHDNKNELKESEYKDDSD